MNMNSNGWYFILFIFLSPFSASAQEGIHFESGLSWDAVKAKAKAENKYIFVDCYATWCGPCKWMDHNIYPLKEVGDYFNSQFINVPVQMDQTGNDLQIVRDWYDDAKTISTTYNLQAYPTYLFFSPDGVIRHRFSGSVNSGKGFIAKASDALDPNKQYYSLIANRKIHNGDSVHMLHLLTMAMDANDDSSARVIGEDYLASLKQPITVANIQIFSRLLYTRNSGIFSLYLTNADGIDQMMEDSTYVEFPLSRIIVYEQIDSIWANTKGPVRWSDSHDFILKQYPTVGIKVSRFVKQQYQGLITRDVKAEIYKNGGPFNNWQELERKIKDKYPGYEIARLILEQKALYYERMKSWDTCGKIGLELLSKYGPELSSRDINNISWSYIFLHYSNSHTLSVAKKWLKASIDKNNAIENNCLDTYANLLYKTGQKEQALVWEKKAIDLAIKTHGSPGDINDYKTSLGKMQKGEKTWED